MEDDRRTGHLRAASIGPAASVIDHVTPAVSCTRDHVL